MIEHEYERGNKHSGSRLGEQFYETQKFILKKLETGIKKKISQIKAQRSKLRASRRESEMCTVAVIGYTNCGKTSLIKALTGDGSMEPRNQLFATLDVTCHGTKLPGSNLQTVFIDTVGFISDIPTPLIASFSATLEDALDADLLLHVADFSHPDCRHQINQVHSTLNKLQSNLSKSDKILQVANKIDLIEAGEWKEIKGEGYLPISATQNYGLDYLSERIERQLLCTSDKVRLRMRLRPGSEEWEWLRRHSSIGQVWLLIGQHYLMLDSDWSI